MSMKHHDERSPTLRRLEAPFAMINLVKVGSSANTLLLDTADYLSSIGAEFIEWQIYFRDGRDPVAYDWQNVNDAREYISKTEVLASVIVVICSTVDPEIGDFERLTSTDAKDPNMPGALVTLNMSGSVFKGGGHRVTDEAAAKGRKICAAMLSMARGIDVSYAAFSCDREMPGVYQVTGGRDPWDHVGGYSISRRLLGEAAFEAIGGLYPRNVVTLANWNGIGVTPFYSDDPYVKANVLSPSPRGFDAEDEIASRYLREALRRAVGQ